MVGARLPARPAGGAPGGALMSGAAALEAERARVARRRARQVAEDLERLRRLAGEAQRMEMDSFQSRATDSARQSVMNGAARHADVVAVARVLLVLARRAGLRRDPPRWEGGAP